MIGQSEQEHYPRRKAGAGFSLIELLVAMGIFLAVGAAAFSLFSRHEVLLGQEQGVANLNIGLRNALAQLQIDVVNAGNGQIQGANVPAWPVGVTILNTNPTTAQCNPSATYPATYAQACFDQLNVVMVDPNTPPLHPQNSCMTAYDTSSGIPLYGTVPTNPVTGLPLYPVATVANSFLSGDQILFVTANGTKFTTAVLTAKGAVSTNPPGDIQLSFNPTNANGTNAYTSNLITGPNDPLGISTYATPPPPIPPGTTTPPPSYLTNSFCSADWVLRLLPIQYSVDVTNPSDPQLVRTQAGVKNVVMDQVIGFKVGAAWWNNNVSTFAYDYSAGDYYNQFTLVRAVRVTVIGRTAPSTDPTYTYRNPFDNGPYQIRGSSIVVNPRNLSMNND